MSSPADLAEIQKIADLQVDFAASPNDGFVQIAWPLVLILAIVAQVTFLVQKQAIDDLRKANLAERTAGKDHLLLELRKQMLLGRVGDVCQDVEELESGLGSLSLIRGVTFVGAQPRHDGLERLCRWAHGALGTDVQRRELRDELYRRALRLEREGPFGVGRMFDTQYTSAELPHDLPPELRLHVLIGDDDASRDARGFALTQVEQRIAKWKERVQDLQWELISLLVDQEEKLPQGIVNRDPAVTLFNAARHLDQLGFSILPSVVGGLREEGGQRE